MLRSLVLAATAAALAACVTAKVERDSQLAQPTVWHATLTPAPGSTLHGSATVMTLTDGDRAAPRSRVTVDIAGSRRGALHAWHIHKGVCGSDGPIVGPARSYTPIPTGGAGAAQLIAEMPFVLAPSVHYFVHVHDAAVTSVEACGALAPVTAVVTR